MHKLLVLVSMKRKSGFIRNVTFQVGDTFIIHICEYFFISTNDVQPKHTEDCHASSLHWIHQDLKLENCCSTVISALEWVLECAGIWERRLSPRLTTWVWFLGPSWRKENNSPKLSSDTYIYTYIWREIIFV